mmetsp:Transcript_65942/g.183700  ORF Transcript_65942/g.183700 Transcript_65942/m.183700 type:complete len:464 (-) Transcript_65942:385-1776(-)
MFTLLPGNSSGGTLFLWRGVNVNDALSFRRGDFASAPYRDAERRPHFVSMRGPSRPSREVREGRHGGQALVAEDARGSLPLVSCGTALRGESERRFGGNEDASADAERQGADAERDFDGRRPTRGLEAAMRVLGDAFFAPTPGAGVREAAERSVGLGGETTRGIVESGGVRGDDDRDRRCNADMLGSFVQRGIGASTPGTSSCCGGEEDCDGVDGAEGLGAFGRLALRGLAPGMLRRKASNRSQYSFTSPSKSSLLPRSSKSGPSPFTPVFRQSSVASSAASVTLPEHAAASSAAGGQEVGLLGKSRKGRGNSFGTRFKGSFALALATRNFAPGHLGGGGTSTARFLTVGCKNLTSAGLQLAGPSSSAGAGPLSAMESSGPDVGSAASAGGTPASAVLALGGKAPVNAREERRVLPATTLGAAHVVAADIDGVAPLRRAMTIAFALAAARPSALTLISPSCWV